MALPAQRLYGRISVRLDPDYHQQHVLQIYAGLYDLAADGEIALELTTNLFTRKRAFEADTLWLEMDHPLTGRVVGVCFDMLDGRRIASLDGLERCDVYLKRSYSRAVLQQLPERLARKVLPFGLNYGCLANRPRFPGKHALAGLLRSKGNGAEGRPTLLHAMKLTLTHRALRGTRLCPYMRAQDFECPPDAPANDTVLFQTRLYEGQDELNAERAEIIRQLKAAFGSRFVGGLEDNDVARRQYPELLTPKSHRKGAYVRMVKQHLVAVTSAGLWDSIGWKLPEYFAASRAIVCEPLRFELPVPLVPGEHYLPARTAEALVAACDRILTDPQLARDLRRGSWSYYRNHIEPSALMRGCLHRALTLTSDRQPGEQQRIRASLEALVAG